MKSAVLIVPAALRQAADAVSEAQGYGSPAYTVPLSSDGGASVTHYGCRADVSDSFIEKLENPPAEALPVIQALIFDISSTLWGADHFEAVLLSNNLTRV